MEYKLTVGGYTPRIMELNNGNYFMFNDEVYRVVQLSKSLTGPQNNHDVVVYEELTANVFLMNGNLRCVPLETQNIIEFSVKREEE